VTLAAAFLGAIVAYIGSARQQRKQEAEVPRQVSPGNLAPVCIKRSGGDYLMVSTRLARKLATAVFVMGLPFGLHWPFFGPDVNLGAVAAK
jgi:hypothetical protein